nr:hypothetical protein [Tanacetum cinerariifolium]
MASSPKFNSFLEEFSGELAHTDLIPPEINEVAPQYLLSLWNEDTIFDPSICSYHISSFLPNVSHRSGTFTKFKVLNESPMQILISTCSPMDQ